MPDGITHSNKDVMFKVLSQNYENKSLAVYGLNVPRIKRLLPANYPAVTATEIHAENPFLLEDDSLLILEYESDPTQEDFLKYNKRQLTVKTKKSASDASKHENEQSCCRAHFGSLLYISFFNNPIIKRFNGLLNA